MATKLRDALQAGLGSTYQLRQELGGGGMSATFIAEEVALGRSVVVKVLSPELTSGMSSERFEREIQLAARLQHAFIVPLLSAGVSGGLPWYTMPLVQGESLRARIAREGALTAGATARILRDVAEALAYAHAQGIVHRDIKPDNILLSATHALVTDFGVAKAISASSVESVTRTGIAIGTPAYMSPEQAAGDPDSDHRADLYALGATAYEMLTGRPLFGQRSAAQVLIAHATEQPEPLAKLVPSVPAELSSLVQQLLAKHPNDRPARAQDVADALAAMLTRWSTGELTPASTRVTAITALALWAAAFVGLGGAAWLGVRWLPIPEWTLPAVVLLMVAALPVMLLSVWLHRPARPIASVPSVSSTSTVGRLEALARPHFTWRRTTRVAAALFAAIVLAAATWAGSRALGIGPAATLRGQGVVDAADVVFVADFDSPASDTSLGPVVSDLLRVELGRTRSIRLVSATLRNQVLLTMDQPASTRVTAATAREFAQRANAKVYLAGSVTQLGSNFLLRSTLFESSTGNELASFTQSARSADDIIRAVDHMGRDISDRLGASLRDVRGAPPLYFTITPSLAAARLFTSGLKRAEYGDWLGAVAQLERAVQADTQFAMAYRSMASYYANAGNRERAVWAAGQAYRFRAKLPPAIQRIVEGTYFNAPSTYDLEKSIAAYEAGIEEFGANPISLNNVALQHLAKRDYDRALTRFRTAVQRDTVSGFAPLSILVPLWALGMKDEARQHVATLSRWMPGSTNLVIARARLASASLLPDSSERVLVDGLRAPTDITPAQRAHLEVMLAMARRAQGKLAQAIASQARAATLDPAQDTVEGIPSSVLFRADLAVSERGDAMGARHILDSIVDAHPARGASAIEYPWLRLATLYALANAPGKAKTFLSTYEQRAEGNIKTYDAQPLALVRGWIALAEKRYAEAIGHFRSADVGECTMCALAPLALAYDQSGQADSAIAVFERYLATNYLAETESRPYLAITYRRLGEMYDARGQTAAAREYYTRLVRLYRDADPDLRRVVVQPVRKRLAALERED